MASVTTSPRPANASFPPADEILRIERLKKYFQVGGGFLGGRGLTIKAVDDVSFSVKRGETFGLVGESGCGKTTLGQTIIRLYEPTDGNIVFNGTDLSRLSAGKMRPHRRDIQMIFQDPSASLDPRMTIGSVIAEPLNIAGIGSREERREKVQELLRVVGLNGYFASRYPHEFSGGQRQRIGIARALALNPSFVVLDEPTSSLDVSVQAQILNLLNDLKQDLGLTYLFVSHNLNVVEYFCDTTIVMYLGKIVESGPSDAMHAEPLHPYTQALMSAVLLPEVGSQRERIVLGGDVPSPINPPAGCRFHTRCPFAMDICRRLEPQLAEHGAGRRVACHLYPESTSGRASELPEATA